MRLIQNGRPVSKLLTLCRKHSIEVADDVTPRELNDKLQQKWFKEGYLRFQITGDPPNNEDRELLRELGFIDEVPPVVEFPPEYPPSEGTPILHEGVIHLGAMRTTVVSRLHYFTTVASSITFQPDWKVHLFGGARSLDTGTPEKPGKENHQVLCTPAKLSFKKWWGAPEQMPKTEADMMEFVWQQSQLPQRWAYELVDTPLQPKDPKNPEGEKRPPNTGDTVNEWVKMHDPKPGYYLALSNQPFVAYQELVLRRLLPPGFMVYACGPKSSLTLPMSTYLDNAAKQLYEELQIKL